MQAVRINSVYRTVPRYSYFIKMVHGLGSFARLVCENPKNSRPKGYYLSMWTVLNPI